MEETTEQKLNRVLDKLDKLLDEKNGVKVSGNGILAGNTEKTNEILDKIQKFCYFLEKRQTEMFEFMKTNKS
jgi:ABC-type transporter Mla subunit MlaD